MVASTSTRPCGQAPVITVRHGADARRLWVGPPGSLNSADLDGAYHGIVPLALEQTLATDWTPASWALSAPLVDRALEVGMGRAEFARSARERCLECGVEPPSRAAFARLLGRARESDVLPFRASATRAAQVASAHLGGARAIDLWSVKEGHTSSVWRVAADGEALAVQIARDARAGVQLSAAARELRAMGDRDPDGVVKVLDIDSRAPAAVCCEWLEGRELHVVADEYGRGRFVAVERFVPRPDGRQAMLATRLSEEASDALWSAWQRSLVVQCRPYNGEARLPRTRVEMNDGDLVLVGRRPVLVDLTPQPRRLDSGRWTLELLNLAAGERTDSPTWGKPLQARRNFDAAVTELLAVDPARFHGFALSSLADDDVELRDALLGS